ncbi:alpha/beta hydrolase [Sorangium cellulosum]|uniref:Alpha/beta hydrolase n=1 Tax=Sorangium cellulosum TaxID=56 RepID=A0A2L0F8X5_SORCE|nr:alpha/beta hydrolase [Sorangium cellulosum]AUX48020.1 alpha/beta hydrolase [Sorangium cellulosum]
MIRGVVEPARLGQVVLPDGRRLGWAEWGPEDGVPVLLCPGGATSRSMGFGGDVVGQLGVRLVSVDRPGLGASDPSPGRTLDAFARDIGRFVEARRLSGVAAVGFSAGAPFALACAAAGVVRGVAVVAGTDELANPVFAEVLAPDVRRLVETVASDPERAEVFFSGFSAEAMWSFVIPTLADVDRAVYTDPVFERVYRRAMDEAFSQGPAGYARDTVLTMSPWPFDPGTLRVPVDLWYGARDTSTVHSPDFGASLAGRLPAAERRVLPEAGGSLLWTHAEEILRSLLERTRGR